MEIKNKMNLSKLNKNTILTGGTILDPVLGKEKKGNVPVSYTHLTLPTKA